MNRVLDVHDVWLKSFGYGLEGTLGGCVAIARRNCRLAKVVYHANSGKALIGLLLQRVVFSVRRPSSVEDQHIVTMCNETPGEVE